MASIPRRTWVFRIGMLLAAGVLSAQPLSAGRLPLVWPTPNRAFLEGKPFEDYIQPTSSGRIESGLFGCTRNGGSRFHEGVDLKTVGRDSRGRATDPVFAAMPGAVVHINRVAGNSSYGIYVVLRHNHDGVRFYTLYSHLASVATGLDIGTQVTQGTVLGIMGTTAAGYVIPRSRAHLHFEMGLRLSDNFDRWFGRKRFGSPNKHGPWNGMNLAGWDPLRFYRLSMEGRIDGARDFLLREPVAVRVRVAYPGMPGLLKRSPGPWWKERRTASGPVGKLISPRTGSLSGFVRCRPAICPPTLRRSKSWGSTRIRPFLPAAICSIRRAMDTSREGTFSGQSS